MAIEIVKPKQWDLAALIVFGLSIVLQGANMASSSSGPVSGTTTTVFAVVQMALCLLAFLVLGKTAKMGTIWGNLLAVGAGVAAMSGVLLSTAIWALA